MRSAIAWLRANLFNNWYNAILTLGAAYLIAIGAKAGIEWPLIDAVWSGTGDDCRRSEPSGACWAVIAEKHRFMLFGTYPYEEHWRPSIAVAAIVIGAGLSTWRKLWSRWLGLVWLGIAVAVGILLYGGVFGLGVVRTEFWGGLPLTILLAVVGVALALPLAVLLALGRRSTMPLIRAVSVGYIELVRGVPLVSVLFMASVMFPLFLPDGVTVDKVLRAQIGIVLFTAAYLAEVIRGGLQAVPRGQYEAAEALGLGYWRTMRLVILPQALRHVIPPMVNSFIATFKDTSLVIVIGLYDLLGAVKTATNDPLWRAFTTEGYLFAAAIFFVFCSFMSRYSQRLEVLLAFDRRGATRRQAHTR